MAELVYLITLSARYNTDCLCFGMEAKSKSIAQRCKAYEVFPFVFMLSLSESDSYCCVVGCLSYNTPGF